MMVNIFQCANCDSFLCVSHLNLERDLFFQLTVIQELEIKSLNLDTTIYKELIL